MKPTIESLLALISGVFDTWSVVLFQSPDEGGAADLVAWHSEDRNINRSAKIPPGKGLVGWILRNKSPLLVDNIADNQSYLGYYHEDYDPDIHCFMGCPLPGGALCVDSKDSKVFSEERQKLLQQFALLIPQIQQMANHTGHSREVNTYFTALEHMAEIRAAYNGWQSYLNQILHLLKDATGFQYTAFATLPESSQIYMVEGEQPLLVNAQGEQMELAVSQGIAGWVLRNGEAVFNEGTNGIGNTPIFGKIAGFPEFAATICQPVVVSRTVVGVLCLASQEPRLFSPELRSFLRMATADLASLLENISLRYTITKLTPKGILQTEGAAAYNPDAPLRKKDE